MQLKYALAMAACALTGAHAGKRKNKRDVKSTLTDTRLKIEAVSSCKPLNIKKPKPSSKQSMIKSLLNFLQKIPP